MSNAIEAKEGLHDKLQRAAAMAMELNNQTSKLLAVLYNRSDAERTECAPSECIFATAENVCMLLEQLHQKICIIDDGL